MHAGVYSTSLLRLYATLPVRICSEEGLPMSRVINGYVLEMPARTVVCLIEQGPVIHRFQLFHV